METIKVYFMFNYSRRGGKYRMGAKISGNNGVIEIITTCKGQTEGGVNYDEQINDLQKRIEKKYKKYNINYINL